MINAFVVAVIGLFSLGEKDLCAALVPEVRPLVVTLTNHTIAITVPLPSTPASPRSLKSGTYLLGIPLVPRVLAPSSTVSDRCVGFRGRSWNRVDRAGRRPNGRHHHLERGRAVSFRRQKGSPRELVRSESQRVGQPLRSRIQGATGVDTIARGIGSG